MERAIKRKRRAVGGVLRLCLRARLKKFTGEFLDAVCAPAFRFASDRASRKREPFRRVSLQETRPAQPSLLSLSPKKRGCMSSRHKKTCGAPNIALMGEALLGASWSGEMRLRMSLRERGNGAP